MSFNLARQWALPAEPSPGKGHSLHCRISRPRFPALISECALYPNSLPKQAYRFFRLAPEALPVPDDTGCGISGRRNRPPSFYSYQPRPCRSSGCLHFPRRRDLRKQAIVYFALGCLIAYFFSPPAKTSYRIVIRGIPKLMLRHAYPEIEPNQ